MANYSASRVVSVRLPVELHDGLRERAKDDGRSISGEIVFLVRESVARYRVSGGKPKKLSGWLAHLDAPETHSEFRDARRQASEALLAGVRRKRSPRARR